MPDMALHSKSLENTRRFWLSLILGLSITVLGVHDIGHAEQVNRKGAVPGYLKKYVPEKAFYSFHVRKGNIVFLQISDDPATEARNRSWPGGCASSRLINLITGQTFYIYESDGSYFCSNFHHDVVGDVQILSPHSVLIGMGGGGRCSLSKRAVWDSRKRRYIIVDTREVWCDPK